MFKSSDLGLNHGKPSRVQAVEKPLSEESRIAEMLTKQTAALEKAVNLLSERATPRDSDYRRQGSRFGGKPLTCWKCGREGHFRAQCPSKDVPSQRPEN